MTVAATVQRWRAGGRMVTVPSGDEVFVRDEPAVDPDPELPPLLVLHGFPSCSYDYAAVLPALAARRRVILPDHLGHGLSDKPNRRYGIRMLADAVEAAVAAVELAEVDLLTHDIGDSIGGELLARDLEGALGFSVRRRVLTNGSIYMDLVHLSDGQQLLLSLPDEPSDLVTEEAWIAGVRGTFAPGSIVEDDDLAVLWAMTSQGDGHTLLPRTIRYIEDRQAEERRYTAPIETHPAPLGVVWGSLDPIAVHAMAERLVATRPGTPLVTLDDVGHYPMVEAPERFARAVVDLLDGAEPVARRETGGSAGGEPPERLTLWQRRALKGLVKQARKRPGEPLSPDDWAAYWKFGSQPQVRVVKRLIRALPSSPRCGFCGAPFAGFGGRVVGPLGYRPSRKNPNLCATCVELAPPGGMTMEIGVLFADLRGFTSRSESITPAEASAHLRRFYAHAEEVFLPQALIDKLIGDEVMALYLPVLIDGRDLTEMDDEARRCVAALMLDHARQLLQRVGYGNAAGPDFAVGLGLDFGEAFIGNIGSAAVHDFTAVGDVVNTAARLQGQAAGGEIIISERVARWLEEPLGAPEHIELKGKQDPVEAYRVPWLSGDDAAAQ